MAHELPALVDDNTFVGYNFITKTYYVRNMDTTTVAQTPEEAKVIFDITAPFNKVTVDEIRQLSIDLEPVTEIHYTWEDTGKYIKSIYFNDYINHSIIYNEPCLYVQGSNEMWDMSSDVGKSTMRDFFWSYFKLHLGLLVSMEIINKILEYYLSLQLPYVYNNIKPREEETDPLYYTNVLTLNNPNNNSRGVYTATKNPDKIYTTEVYDVKQYGKTYSAIKYPIESMQLSNKALIMKKLISSAYMTVGASIIVEGTGKNDGTYTISAVETYQDPNIGGGPPTTVIKVNQALKENFSGTYDTAFIKFAGEQPTQIHEDFIEILNEHHLKKGNSLQLRGTDNISNLHVKQVTEGTLNTTTGEHTYKVYTNEVIPDSTDGAINKLYAVAWKIAQIGCSDYSVVVGTRGVNKINGSTVYIAGGFKEATEFDTSKPIYLNYGKDDIRGPYNITGVTPTTQPSTAGTAVSGGYITISASPGNYTYSVGKEPISLEVRETVRADEDSITIIGSFSASEDDIIEIKNSSTPSLNGAYVVDHMEKHQNYTDSNKLYKIFLKDIEDPLTHYSAVSDITNTSSLNSVNNTPVLQPRIASERILMDMSYSRHAEKVPTGKFMFDDNYQLTKYLETYFITPPTSTNYGNINGLVDSQVFLGNDLMFTSRNIGDYQVFTDKRELEHYAGSTTPTDSNYYAFVKSGPSDAAFYKRYRYDSADVTSNETIYRWVEAPEPTYMTCEGLYSEKYDKKD